jgi:hypothetical protein
MDNRTWIASSLPLVMHGDFLGDIPTVQQTFEQGAASLRAADREGMIALALAAHIGDATIQSSTVGTV